MNSQQLRQKFVSFFTEKNHKHLPSSSLVPHNDKTLLFTNAGMVPFKDRFLGLEKDEITRAVTIQKCVRAGGKHNDLENVGYTARHHTFFEMMGNFSFGDYFKQQAISFAWQFLTKELKIPEQKLWVTVHIDDTESEKIWFEDIGIDKSRFSKLDADNFWQMGNIGPCGPCSEIYYDHGPSVAGDPPGGEFEGDRYVEIWNLVFMQFNQDENGNRENLPNPCVDTGMGLERMASVLQGVNNNYHIDIFVELKQEIVKLAKTKNTFAEQVIADHIRATVFMIADGLEPSSDGRGYVLRRIMRRAINYGRKLKIQGAFLHKLVAVIVRQMQDNYPNLKAKYNQITAVILQEEQQFNLTLTKGLTMLEKFLQENKNIEQLPGAIAFKLYDTYGFPLDITKDIAKDRGLAIDITGYNKLMAEQKYNAKANNQFSSQPLLKIEQLQPTNFLGYGEEQVATEILALFDKNSEAITTATAEQQLISIITQSTPFYAESGGQVADTGTLKAEALNVEIIDCQKHGEFFVHIAKVLTGTIQVKQTVQLTINRNLRQAIKANHSATHLLHQALRNILGDKIQQKGSLVDGNKLRFDFSYNKPLTKQQIQQVNLAVNRQIWANTKIETKTLNYDDAIDCGAIALFGEKYQKQVRVLFMGTDPASNQASDYYSIELCGGTHCSQTGDIGQFTIVLESGVSAGIRRIEAVTRDKALEYNLALQQQMQLLKTALKVEANNIVKEVSKLKAQVLTLQKAQHKNKQQDMVITAKTLEAEVVAINGVNLLVKVIKDGGMKDLLAISDSLQSKFKSLLLILVSKNNDKSVVLGKVSKDLLAKINLKENLKLFFESCNGKGGGSPSMVQGAVTDSSNLEQQLSLVKQQLETLLEK